MLDIVKEVIGAANEVARTADLIVDATEKGGPDEYVISKEVFEDLVTKLARLKEQEADQG